MAVVKGAGTAAASSLLSSLPLLSSSLSPLLLSSSLPLLSSSLSPLLLSSSPPSPSLLPLSASISRGVAAAILGSTPTAPGPAASGV